MRSRKHVFALVMPAATLLLALTLSACGGNPQNGCLITAVVTPAAGSADHTLLAPGNQVQFATSFSVRGDCAVTQVIEPGVWTTSDPANTTVSNNPPTQGLATCMKATPAPATISYTGKQSGSAFAPAKLTCR